ncbi:MAG TPA: Na+/H+ antiporter NhaA [Anaerolineae bacterium]|jgi:NhaA family Na+:H+ antiporter|nr:Na+/H+ antiporter NhaA [Anaerolineae bacterium]
MSSTIDQEITTIITPRKGFGRAFQEFFETEVAGSSILLVCAIIALIWANSPWADIYFDLLHLEFGFIVGSLHYELSLHEWVNDGLMAFFFLVVGLEVKRELVVGELSSSRRAILPITAAVGGMLIPAAVYLILNFDGDGVRGWGVPMATDIAFALGVLALLGSRVPPALKVFITALAIADDLGAIAVLAIFYTEQIIWIDVIISIAFLAILYGLVRLNIRRIEFFAILVIGAWAAMLLSGIHATVAGILLAMIIPVRAEIKREEFLTIGYEKLDELTGGNLTTDSMIHDHQQMKSIIELHAASRRLRPPGLTLERYLHPVVVFVILPLFALTNAGVPITDGFFDTLLSPVALGIVFGLVLGKQMGVTLFSWLAIRSGYANMPAGVTWGQIYGVGWLTGIGFTMSLFITELAFDDPVLLNQAKVGILVASLVAGVGGYLVLRRLLPVAEDVVSWRALPQKQPAGD